MRRKKATAKDSAKPIRTIAELRLQMDRVLYRVLGRWWAMQPEEVLENTPFRFMRLLVEMTGGYAQQPEQILSKRFRASYDEMIYIGGVPFWSLCEHHLAPFHGTVSLAYIPAREGYVIGLSKGPRLVQCFARRLQLQERMTTQIAQALDEYLQPVGVGVVVRARHMCMEMRGVRSPGETVTSCLLGRFRSDWAVRQEFLSMTNYRGNQ